MWSAVTDRPAPTAASSSAASEAVAPVLPGMAEEEADDPNEYFEPEPVDPTIEELKVSEQACRPADGRVRLGYVCAHGFGGRKCVRVQSGLPCMHPCIYSHSD